MIAHTRTDGNLASFEASIMFVDYRSPQKRQKMARLQKQPRLRVRFSFRFPIPKPCMVETLPSFKCGYIHSYIFICFHLFPFVSIRIHSVCSHRFQSSHPHLFPTISHHLHLWFWLWKEKDSPSCRTHIKSASVTGSPRASRGWRGWEGLGEHRTAGFLDMYVYDTKRMMGFTRRQIFLHMSRAVHIHIILHCSLRLQHPRIQRHVSIHTDWRKFC